MKVLGALLAGGKSERYGSDKAFAVYRGQYLIDHALGLLKSQCDAIAICGRSYKDYESIQDDPEDYGPLGAINAALKYAKLRHYDAIISFPCDTIIRLAFDALEEDAIDAKSDTANWFEGDRASYFIDQPVIGYWPCTLSNELDQWLQNQNRRSIKAWIEYIGSKSYVVNPIVPSDRNAVQFININRPEDLIF